MSLWAEKHIALLRSGRRAEFRPTGRSMEPRIFSGQLVFVEPVAKGGPIVVGDVVLCTVGQNHYLHLVKAIGPDGFLIGNNKGRVNGWIPFTQIHGRLAAVRP